VLRRSRGRTATTTTTTIGRALRRGHGHLLAGGRGWQRLEIAERVVVHAAVSSAAPTRAFVAAGG